jgi:3-oxoacyl-[acyl-carrier protein] reductase
MMNKKIRVAVWEPNDRLIHNINKLNLNDYEIMAFFTDNVDDDSTVNTRVRRREEVKNAEYDYLIISYDNFRQTREELSSQYGIIENVFTWEEFWVKDCESIITEKYHSLWKSMKDANIGTFEGKTVIILGGSSGIGRECAVAYAYAGANVLVAGRNVSKLQEVCNEVGEIGRCNYIEWDIREVDGFKDKMEKAEHIAQSEIDIVVNSAGVVDGTDKDFFAITPEIFDNVIETNLKGTYFLCQTAAEYFIQKKKKGHIVNVVSELGFLPTVKPYGISKWGMVGLTKGLGMNLAEYGIVVNGIAPGEVATPILHWEKGNCPARRAKSNGRVSFPCEVAQTILHLSGFMGENMIGEVIECDGGERSISMRL